MKIKDINDEIFIIYSKLDSLSSPKMVECLNAFMKNIDFVEWLQKHAPNEDALKLLADFAAESENEGALEVRRVQTLLLVGTAYGPLIYHLDKKSNFETLLKRVDNVRVNLETNPELPNRIVRPNLSNSTRIIYILLFQASYSSRKRLARGYQRIQTKYGC